MDSIGRKDEAMVSVHNYADDGKRPEPLGDLQIPIRERAEHEMALHEQIAEGTSGKDKFAVSRTFDGHFWVTVNETCYVIALQDMVRATFDLLAKKGA